MALQMPGYLWFELRFYKISNRADFESILFNSYLFNSLKKYEIKLDKKICIDYKSIL
jgi:hypothetical protein